MSSKEITATGSLLLAPAAGVCIPSPAGPRPGSGWVASPNPAKVSHETIPSPAHICQSAVPLSKSSTLFSKVDDLLIITLFSKVDDLLTWTLVKRTSSALAVTKVFAKVDSPTWGAAAEAGGGGNGGALGISESSHANDEWETRTWRFSSHCRPAWPDH